MEFLVRNGKNYIRLITNQLTVTSPLLVALGHFYYDSRRNSLMLTTSWKCTLINHYNINFHMIKNTQSFNTQRVMITELYQECIISTLMY